MKNFRYLVVLLFLITVTPYVVGQSYIGNTYEYVKNHQLTKYETRINFYDEGVALDNTKYLHVTYLSKQFTGFAFDFEDNCIFYVVLMPDTTGHRLFTNHLDGNYIRSPTKSRWIEKRSTDDIVWRFTKTTDGEHSLLFVYSESIEPHINYIIMSF